MILHQFASLKLMDDDLSETGIGLGNSMTKHYKKSRPNIHAYWGLYAIKLKKS